MPKDPQRKYRTQQYRREWEKESWADGWLSASRKNNLKAYCCFCDKELVVGKSELLCHSKTNLHRRNAKQFISAVAVSDYFEFTKWRFPVFTISPRRLISFIGKRGNKPRSIPIPAYSMKTHRRNYSDGISFARTVVLSRA